MSQSSEDYNVIVNNFLDCNREWQRVPEVVYLTIKAMFQHSEMLQEKLQAQKQLTTQQSIKFRQLQVQFKTRLQQNQGYNQMMEQYQNYQQSGFRKNKRQIQKVLSSKSQLKYQSSRGKKIQDGTSNIKSPNKSIQSQKIQRGCSQVWSDDVKKLVDAAVEEKVDYLMKQMMQMMQKLKEELGRSLEQNQGSLGKELLSFREGIENMVEGKLRQSEKMMSNKVQLERNNIKNMVEETAKENEKIWVQLDGILMKFNIFGQDTKLRQQNPIYSIQKQKKSDIDSKQPKPSIQSNDNRILQLQSTLSKQFMQFKLHVMKQMSSFLKLGDLESVFKKYQMEVGEKIKKASKGVAQLEKEMGVMRKDLLAKSQVKVVVPNIKQVEKDRSSEESLRAIQGSLESVENYFKQKLKTFRKQLMLQMENSVEQVKQDLIKQLHQQIQFRQKSLCQIVQLNCNKVISLQQKFCASGEYLGLRKSLEKISEQMILARYLHFGQRLCKEFVEWEKDIYSAMQENFSWKNGSPYVTVVAAGLYRVEVGLYLDNESDRIEAFLMLNGQRISQLKSKEVPVNSKASARGSIFNEAILLPARSKLAVKLELPFLGQGYLQIQKL